MGKSVGEIELDLNLNDNGFNKAVNSITGMAKTVGKTLAAAFAIDKLVGFGKECLDLGSDLAEVQNVVDVAFGPTVSKQIDSFAKSAAQSFGLSETMAKKYAGTFGAMATAFGFSQQEAADMSTQLTGLAGDVASFYNISQDEAYTKLKSVFTGETESLKDLGVVMTQTALDSYAMANGFGKTTAQMSEAEKVALRYSFVQNQLSNAAGDFARTSDSWANQTRILALQFDSLKASIGQGLINLFQPIIVQVNTLLKKLVGLSEAFARFTGLLTGKKSSDNGVADTAAMAAKADDNMSGAAKSASALTKNTKAAGKAAKKAAKEMFGLASWDELSNNTSSKTNNKDASSKAATGSSGGSGTKATPGLPVADDAAEGTNKVLEKFKDIIDKIKTALQPTIQAIKNLWNALKPLKDFTIQALLDFYNKFLKPVGKWVLGEGLPRFINALANGLSKIDYAKINKALAGLWEALAPFAINVGKGLLWFWEKVLVPLGTWTANEVVPRFLKTLSTVIGVLNTVIEGLKPLANWLWTNFLQKLASFTAAVFLKAWDGINNALGTFSTWLSKNKGVVSGFTVTVGAFFAAWKTVELLSFIQQSGSVIAALKLVAKGLLATRIAKVKDVAETAILNAMYAKDFVVNLKNSIVALANQAKAFAASLAAKIADKAETLALQALYAKDFVVSLASSTAALVKQAAQFAVNTAAKVADTAAQVAATAATVAWNVACGIATVATTAFGVAMAVLTSPITLVIAGLVALVAAGVAVYKNWDKIKAKAEEIWKKIVAIFSPVGAWFKTKFTEAGNNITKVFNGLKAVFALVWKNIQSVFANVGGWFKGVFDKAFANVKNAFATAKAVFANVWNAIKGAFAGAINWFKSTFLTASGHLKNPFSGIGNFFAGKYKDIKKAFSGVGDWFSEKFKGTYSSATKAWSGAKDAFKGILANIKAPFKGIADWFDKTFGAAWTKVKAVFSSKGKIFDGIKEGIDKTFKAVVNTLIKGLNVIVEKPFVGINKMLNKLRTAGVGKLKPFAKLWNENPIAVPKIPALAQGGYVRANTPQLAMIGDNKRYGEIVAPENKLQAMVDRAVQMSGTASATALVPVIERLCNAIIELEQNGGSGISVEKYKEGDLLKVVRQENNRYKRQHGASALI